jgi:hypothetical protein
MTVSMTWITPLLAAMSVLTTRIQHVFCGFPAGG